MTIKSILSKQNKNNNRFKANNQYFKRWTRYTPGCSCKLMPQTRWLQAAWSLFSFYRALFRLDNAISAANYVETEICGSSTHLRCSSSYFTTNIPNYAILSHAWHADEISFHEFQAVSKTQDVSTIEKAGNRKIMSACDRACQHDTRTPGLIPAECYPAIYNHRK